MTTPRKNSRPEAKSSEIDKIPRPTDGTKKSPTRKEKCADSSIEDAVKERMTCMKDQLQERERERGTAREVRDALNMQLASGQVEQVDVEMYLSLLGRVMSLDARVGGSDDSIPKFEALNMELLGILKTCSVLERPACTWAHMTLDILIVGISEVKRQIESMIDLLRSADTNDLEGQAVGIEFLEGQYKTISHASGTAFLAGARYMFQQIMRGDEWKRGLRKRSVGIDRSTENNKKRAEWKKSFQDHAADFCARQRDDGVTWKVICSTKLPEAKITVNDKLLKIPGYETVRPWVCEKHPRLKRKPRNK